jgi:membrane protease YdiL (CAAX protease family)
MLPNPEPRAAVQPPSALDRRWRAAELVLLFGAAPGLLAVGPRWLVSVCILASGLVCLVMLLRDRTFERRALWDAPAAARGARAMLLRTAAIWGGLLLLTLVFTPQTLFIFPRQRPYVWVAVMVLYPVSAWAQELVFRTFFFHRYGGLFASARGRVLASGLIFGWAHIVVNNVYAVPLAAIAGVLFASTYQGSRSTLLVSLEHALYGDFLFSVGLGSLFYSTARWIAPH